MANTKYVTENRLRLEAQGTRNKRRKTVLIGGLVFALVSGVLTNSSIALVVMIIVGVFFLLITADARIISGAVGEEMALQVLQKLPDEYTIFNQVYIPNKNSRTGFNEADLIVLGPKCVFVIEVKHNNGSVVGSESLRQWDVHKVGRRGTAYTAYMRNPIAQVKKLVWLLTEELKKRESRMWLQGVVVFTNIDSTVRIDGDVSVPVLSLETLLSYIVDYKGNSKPLAVSRVENALADLKNESNSFLDKF